MSVTFTEMPWATVAVMADKPAGVAGILMNRLGRSTIFHSSTACETVLSASWASRGSTSMDSRMKSSLAVAALDHAVALRSPVAAIVHSNRGSQFRSRKFVQALSRNGLHGSMGSVGACGDNAAMESFFALLQRNVLDRQRWTTRAELRLAIATWIERTYHRRRRQRALGKLTPIEFELLHTPAATAA